MRRILSFGLLSAWLSGWIALSAPGCHFVTDFDPGRVESTQKAVYVFPEQSTAQGFDVLFVVDTRDGSFLESLRDRVVRWVESIAIGQGMFVSQGGDRDGAPTLPGETGDEGYVGPSPMEYALHVGFISANVGLGSDGMVDPFALVAGCAGDGDGGRLLHPALAPPGQAGYAHPFLVIQWGEVTNVRDGMGGYQTVQVGQAVQDFWEAVVAQQTECPFSQPLEALRLAVAQEPLDNLGFRRPKSGLGVVVISPTDDCSVTSSGFFYDELGEVRQVSPFECFRYGVECNEADLVTPGPKTGCGDLRSTPEGFCPLPGLSVEGPEDPSFTPSLAACFAPARSYAEVITAALAPYPVAAAIVAGPAEPVEVVSTAGGPALAPAAGCEGAYPSIRLNAFASAADAGRFVSLCDVEATDPLGEVINDLANRSVVRCISDPLVDTNPDTPELDPSCQVERLNVKSNGVEEDVVTVPPCGSGPEMSVDCWRIVADAKLCPGGMVLYIESNMEYVTPDAKGRNTTRATCDVRKGGR